MRKRPKRQFEYTYTVGMDEKAIRERLEAAETGVLSLADGGDAYSFPVAYHWDGEAFVFRLASTATARRWRSSSRPTRRAFPSPTTGRPASPGASSRPAASSDEADLLESQDDFHPLRIFGEAVDELEPVLYAREVESLTGRTT